MMKTQIEFKEIEQFQPQLEEVKRFFSDNDFPESEGEVFYYYFSSMGWRNERGVKVLDWKQEASLWLWNLDS